MKKLTSEEFILKAIKVHGDRYDYSKVKYVNSYTKVIIICPIHGEFYLKPAKHLSGLNCPKCTGTRRKTTEEFIEQAKQIHGNLYDYSKTVYGKNCLIPVEIICKKHGSFWQTPRHHINCKCGCPLCNISHGEELLMHYFDNSNIIYETQYKICVPTDIRKTGIIKIDFYLPEYNTFVEYNGKQHYILQEGFGGKIKFDQLVIRDNYLRSYCVNNSINLIEISYKEKDPIKYLITHLIK